MARVYWSDPNPRPAPAWLIAGSIGWAAALGWFAVRSAFALYERLHQ